MQGTPVLEVEEQRQESYLYFLGKPRPRPSPKGLKMEKSEQITHLSRGQSPSTGPKLSGVRRRNGWRPRLRSPGLVAFKDTGTEQGGGGQGKEVSGPVSKSAKELLAWVDWPAPLHTVF